MRNLKPLILSLALAGPFVMSAHAGEDDGIDMRLARIEQEVKHLKAQIQSMQVRRRGTSAYTGDAGTHTKGMTPSERTWRFWDAQAANGS